MNDFEAERKVWLQNVRDNQIGGETDGISVEVAEDLGFKPPEIFASVGSSAMTATTNETKRARRTRRNFLMTPKAIKARERRARSRREADEKMQREKGPFDLEFGGK